MSNTEMIEAGHAALHDFGDGESVAELADELAYALKAAEAERDSLHADLREAQQLLHIVAGRDGGLYISRAEIIAYQDGGSFHVESKPDGLHVTHTD